MEKRKKDKNGGTGISRRDFLKGAAAGAAAVATVGVLPACTTVGAGDARSAPASDFFAKPDPIRDISQTINVDVVVVGAGNGGCVSAVSALDAGARVAWVEKNIMPIMWAGEIAALNSRVAREEFGVSYTLEQRNEIVNEICRYASYECDQRLIKLWAENSGRTMDWFVNMMQRKGLSMFLETHMKETRYMTLPVTHTVYRTGEFAEMGPNEMGSQLANPAWVEYGHELGAEMLFEHTAKQLVQSSAGAITGIIIQRNSDGRYIRINAAKGVIIATG